MTTVGSVVRRLSRKSLQSYFAKRQIDLPDIDWASAGKTTKPVLAAIEGLNADTHARIVNDTGRVGALADEPGQAAIYSVVNDPTVIDELANGYERSLWLFVNEPALFQRAEEARYTDERRRGKHWDGFVVDSERRLRRDEAAVAAFREAIRQRVDARISRL